MKPILVYDTETSGLPLFKEPSEHPDQPHVVQLAAQMVDHDSRRVISTLNLIIQPDGWLIPDDVAKVHGITTEFAAAHGVPEGLAVEMLLEMNAQCSHRVAHNEQFDARIVRIACMRHMTDIVADEWKHAPAQCTARMSTPVIQLPPTDRMRSAGRFHYKTPNLGEAYRYFTGRELVGAHNAMVDAEACRDLYFALLDGSKGATEQAA